MSIRVCAVRLWLLLHVTAVNVHPCFALEYVEELGVPLGGEYSQIPSVDVDRWQEKYEAWENHHQSYFYVHNETRIAMARAEAEAHHDGGGVASDGTTPSSIVGSATFPDFPPSWDGCNFASVASDLSTGRIMAWDAFRPGESPANEIDIHIVAVDSCARGRNVDLGLFQEFEFCSHRWGEEKVNILIRDDSNPPTHSFDVLVRLRARGTDLLADGIYVPATGKMHLVGCTIAQQYLPDFSIYSNSSTPLSPESPPRAAYWYDSYGLRAPPLNSSALDDCAISATVQYPQLNSRWNWDRVVKYWIRSTRAENDPLYFSPMEGSAFFPYLNRRYKEGSEDAVLTQRGLETGGRILLLVLGLVCIARQIEHGRNNEESLPFVSLVMLGIQLAHHLSQTSIFKDLQIMRYQLPLNFRGIPTNHNVIGSYSSFPDSTDGYDYYGIMAWSEHVPYQAMAMAAIFMYVWIFHRVGDRRRIMQLRVLRRRVGAKDPPSDWRVMYLTLTVFSFAGVLGFWVIGADQSGHFRRALTGMTAAAEDRYHAYRDFSPFSDNHSPFVSSRFYTLSQAQWGFVNRLTGLVVSFFLVPQLLGNMQWDLQGRPLSVWFYAGVPFLLSLPHVFSIAKYFQLVPIFPSFDPYLDSLYGIFVNPTPWWQIGVVLLSSLQVLAVHFQFARSLHGSRHSTFKTSDVQQTCDTL